MKFHTISSSSKGNGYLLEREDGRCLVLEAGVDLKKIKALVKFNLQRITGVVVSHAHGDHAKYIYKYLEAGLNVYGPKMAITHHRYHVLEPGEKVTLDGFRFIPMEVKHDVQCYAYLIVSEGKKIAFVTDTYVFPYKIPTATNWLIEANFSHEIIRNGSDNQFLKDRIYESHMDIETTINVVEANKSTNLRNVVLLHLSDRNSNSEDFIKQTQARIGVPVHIADIGTEILL